MNEDEILKWLLKDAWQFIILETVKIILFEEFSFRF